MQLEESDSANDVPPLSCRGILTLSRYVEKNTALHTQSGFVGIDDCCQFSALYRSGANQGVLV